jgi:hypothetical protein
MSKYIETALSAAAYQRCKKITIYNPYMGVPTVQFEEEMIIKRADGSALHDNLSTMTKLINNYSETFPIYNPVTQAKTGATGTVAQLYAMIWSVYMNEAVYRDAHLAKVAVLDAFQVQDRANKVAADAAVALIWANFTTADAAALVTATALADTMATPEEKAVVMADYEAAKATAYTAASDAAALVVTNYDAAKVAAEAQSVIDAQAAYDAVLAA